MAKKVFQRAILERGIKATEDCPFTIAEVVAVYASGRKQHRFAEPTKEDHKIAATYAKIGSYGTCQKYGLGLSQVNAAVWRVGRAMVLSSVK